MSDDVNEFVNALFSSSRPKMKTPPLKAAQRNELRIIFESTTKTYSFRKGDLVKFKHLCGAFKEEAKAGLVFMFWSYLTDLPEKDEDRFRNSMLPAEKSSVAVADCIVAMLLNGCFVFHVTESAMLEPDTDTDETT